MSKYYRQLQGYNTEDEGTLANLEYNNPAGSQKVSEVGRHLLPIPFINAGVVNYTITPTAATVLPSAGKLLAVYNNSGTLGSITLGSDNTVTVVAAGVVNPTTGAFGYPCIANGWTYIPCDTKQWVISSASTLYVYLVDDWTSLKIENP